MENGEKSEREALCLSHDNHYHSMEVPAPIRKAIAGQVWLYVLCWQECSTGINHSLYMVNAGVLVAW